MRDRIKKQTVTWVLVLMAAALLAGCSKTRAGRDSQAVPGITNGQQSSGFGNSVAGASEETAEAARSTGASTLEVRFGDSGAPFILELEDNETAAAIARHVGTADWRLPIYHYGCDKIGLNQKTLI